MPHLVPFSLSPNSAQAVRVLVIPGLHDSGPGHWQTWLQRQYAGAVRVVQRDWADPQLDHWADRIDQTLARHAPQTEWIAVAHSFGCLALAHHLARRTKAGAQAHEGGIRAALLAAPADPLKFGVADRLPTTGLGLPTTLIGSENDPWMPLDRARQWAHHWGARFVNLGEAGHINTESGYGPWPLARFHVDHMVRNRQRLKRLERAHPLEFGYAV